MIAVIVSPSRAHAQETKYLAFQMFSGIHGPVPGGDWQDKSCPVTIPSRSDMENFADRLIDTIGGTGTSTHKLALMIGPLAWDYTDSQLISFIKDAFSIAQSKNIAIGFHIDDSKFWTCRKDFFNDPRNREKINWDAPLSNGQYIDWGSPAQFPPQMCLNSPVLEKEARRIAADIYGKHISAALKTINPNLFAGVIVGWETAIGDDYKTRRRTGYCMLKNLGYSKTSPPKTQEEKDKALTAVLKNWLYLWSKTLHERGVPKEKLYSHIAFLPRKRTEQNKNIIQRISPHAQSYEEALGYATSDAAFGHYHNPGFSTYPSPARFREIYSKVQKYKSTGWASSEGGNIIPVPNGSDIPKETMETYLARMFNHGATLTTIFGWGLGKPGGGFTKSSEAPESLTAYRTFLSGKPLEEEPLTNESYSVGGDLPKKIQSMHKAIHAYAKRGGDMRRIQSLAQNLEKHLETGQLEEAHKIVDQILSITAK